MSIARFFNEDVVVRRLRAVDSTRTAVQATATVDGHIQVLGKEARQAMGIVSEKVYEAWFRVDAEIQEGDTITDSKGKQYLVDEVAVKDYGINQHKECILFEYNG